MPEGEKARGWAGRRSLRRERAGGLRAARLGVPDEGAWQVVGGEHGVRCQRGGTRYEALYVGAGVLCLLCGVCYGVRNRALYLVFGMLCLLCGVVDVVWHLCCVACFTWHLACDIWCVLCGTCFVTFNTTIWYV